MSSSTFAALLTAGVSSSWDYLSASVTALWPFAIAIALLSAGIFFVLKRLHWI